MRKRDLEVMTKDIFTIEEMLKSRYKNPILHKELVIDICKRIRRIEKRVLK